MRSRFVLLGFILVVSSCGGGSSPSETSESAIETTVITTTSVGLATTTVVESPDDDGIVKISVTVGVDSGADRVEEVKLGQQVELTITNPDDDDEFHLHGYDLGGDETPAGEDKVFAFTATEAGDFEVESHATEEVLVVLRVS